MTLEEVVKVLENIRQETVVKDILVGGFDKEIEALAIAVEELGKIVK